MDDPRHDDERLDERAEVSEEEIELDPEERLDDKVEQLPPPPRLRPRVHDGDDGPAAG